MIVIFIAVACLSIVAVIAGQKKSRGPAVLKTMTTVSLFGMALVSNFRPDPHPLALGITIGLAFCAVGDYVLAISPFKNQLLYGLSTFLVGYGIYGFFFHSRGQYTLITGITIVALCILAIIQYATIRKLPKETRVPVIIYSIVVSSLVVGAVSYATSRLRPLPPSTYIAPIAAVLIYISDSLTAMLYFC